MLPCNGIYLLLLKFLEYRIKYACLLFEKQQRLKLVILLFVCIMYKMIT